VLLVDDERSIRLVLRRTLAKDGWEVEEVADGVAAVALLDDERRRWAAIVLDVTLPGVSGIDILRRLQTRRPDLARRVVLTSGASSDALDGAGCPVLHKPFDIEVARELVRRAAEG
jgi:DNA-binding response OmpR family regulator